MIKQKDVSSFVWYGREDTLDNEILSQVFSDVTFSKYIGELSLTEYGENLAPELQAWVIEKLKQDENAFFNIYVTAEYYWMGIYGVEELGLDETRVQTTMYSCGTIDYVVERDITKENAYNTFENKKEKFETAIDDARSNLYAGNWSMYFLYKEDEDSFDTDYILLNSLRNNVTYYLQFPELITYEDEQVKSEMDNNANIKKIIAKEQFNTLSDEQKQEFFRCINLDKEEFDENYFNSESGKYLVITGTNPYYGTYSKEEFENMISQVVEKYSDEYKLLYKPHPSAIPTEEEQEYLNSLEIEVLLGKMPMEAISFIYSDIKLGGFGSSLYMSVDEGSTLFFFIDNSDNLVSPLNILYDELFSEAECIEPNI